MMSMYMLGALEYFDGMDKMELLLNGIIQLWMKAMIL